MVEEKRVNFQEQSEVRSAPIRERDTRWGKTWTQRSWRFLASVEFAVLIMISLTLAMIVATILEAIYDTPTGSYWVYRATYFKLILAALGLNLAWVMVDRWPWQRRHIPFLLAHIGILLLLVGSWVTQKFGIDGMMRVEEGTATSRVEIDELHLSVMRGEKWETFPIRWIPPMVSFKPIRFKKYGFEAVGFLSHADAKISFVAQNEESRSALQSPPSPRVAAKVLLKSGPKSPMRISEEAWLWKGDPGWESVQVGPAWISLKSDFTPPAVGAGMPAIAPILQLQQTPGSVDQIQYISKSSEGKLKSGVARVGETIDLGWRGDMKITFLEWIPVAESRIDYLPARIQYGRGAPPAAIQLRPLKIDGSSDPSAETTWVGVGDRVTLSDEVFVSFNSKQIQLPFQIRLERFFLEHYEGSMDPSKYASDVTVLASEGKSRPFHISMNEPLKEGVFTFYQSSYEPAEPRPTVSIFSVNYDPGRSTKYWGSLILVLGIIWLFAVKLRQKRGVK